MLPQFVSSTQIMSYLHFYGANMTDWARTERWVEIEGLCNGLLSLHYIMWYSGSSLHYIMWQWLQSSLKSRSAVRLLNRSLVDLFSLRYHPIANTIMLCPAQILHQYIQEGPADCAISRALLTIWTMSRGNGRLPCYLEILNNTQLEVQ